MSRNNRKKYNKKFAACCEFIIDADWKLKFQKMAKGKFPVGVTYDGDTLTHKKTGKTFSTKDIEDPYALATKVRAFLYDLGYMSRLEKMSKKLLDAEKNAKVKTWKSLKNVRTRDHELQKFVERLVEVGKVQEDSYVDVYKTLQYYHLVGCLEDKNVVFEEGKLVDIKNLELTELGFRQRQSYL